MGSCCENCRKWAIDTYWTRFQVVQFYTVIPRGPHLQLRFPEKFVQNLKEELLENVVLKGPSGLTWNLGLMRNGDDLFIQNGWEEFAKDHNLKEGEFLLFRYHGESRFEVFMFDQSNYCEKESSYFVRKCCSEEGNGNQESNVSKRTEMEASLEIILSGEASARYKKKLHIVEPDVETQQLLPNRGITSISTGRRNHFEPTPTLAIVPVVPKAEEENVSDSSSEEEKDELNPSYPFHYVSRRRQITEAEKNRAYALAVREGASCKKGHFLVVMKQSHVSSRFYLRIPSEAARTYFPRKTADVTLQFERQNWPAKFFHYKSSSVIRGPGWENFILENNLEVGDVCLFVLTSVRKQGTIPIEVHIFRVVKEVVPLTKVASGGKKRIQRML